MEPPQNIALLPPPLFLGHLIPFIELSRTLVLRHNFTVTLILPHDPSSIETLIQELPPSINPIFLPADDLGESHHPEILAATRVARSLPSLRHALSPPPAALVVDLFAPYAIDVAKEMGIPAYVFFTSAAYQLLMFLDFTALDLASLPPEMRGPPPEMMLPGSVVLKKEDYSDLMRDANVEVQKWFVDLTNRYLTADGILVNSFKELEPEAFKDLELRHGSTPVYPVGPLILETEKHEHDHCIKWLNNQPPNSVLFVSFGSGGALPVAQFQELALGLEMSGRRFLWVVRSPQDDDVASAASYLNAQEEKSDPFEFLPEGFLERTKGRGLVVPDWAPQVRVLRHGSTRGFVTHCGWNSILESVVHGVPMIAWPICFEQRMNAVYLREGLKGALGVREDGNRVVGRDRIAAKVKELMEGEEEGEEVRKRVVEFKVAAGDALSLEGSSRRELAQVVRNWIRDVK